MDADGTDQNLITTLVTAERRLQAAQLAADADTIAELLDDRVRFSGPDGGLYDKADEDRVQRSGAQAFTVSEELDLQVAVAGETGVTWVLMHLAGTVNGEFIDARLRYTRTWIRTGTNWRILAAQATFV